jgi:1-acyl-sn-glycerol-3-phosphate acyltransferase
MLARMSTSTDTTAASVYTDADYDPWVNHDSRLVERIVRVLSIWWWDHVYRLRAVHVERVPTEGAFLLVPNHSSYTDPFLNARPLSRRVRFMAKSTMFTYPVMRTVMRGGGAFPVRRGKGDTFAIELARRMLLDGQPVVVYPEGTRYRSSLELGPAKRGAARLALETGVPVVPAATWGVKRRELYGRAWWRRPKAVVVYGEAMDFSHLEPTPENVDYVRDVVWARVHELYDEAREIASAKRRR